MKKLFLALALLVPLTGAAQIPTIDDSWQIIRSNANQVVYGNERGVWGVAIGVTNAAPPIAALPGGGNVWDWVRTNIIAHTNGRVTAYYTTNNWTSLTTAPQVTRNTNSLIFGAVGFTAITTHNTMVGAAAAHGQIQACALTKRHAIWRGHGAGAMGTIVTNGTQKLFFVTSNNVPVQVTVRGQIGFSCCDGPTIGMGRDYTIAVFSSDLPDTIEPVSILPWTQFTAYFPLTNYAQYAWFDSCQHNVTTAIMSGGGGFSTHNTWVGGDSGSPKFIPLPHATRRFELAIFALISGSPMQDDVIGRIDELSTWAGLNPALYPPTLIDIPTYTP
jgi:hypothetical protein